MINLDAVFFNTYGGYNKGHRSGIAWTDEVAKAGSKRREPADPETLPSPKHGSGTGMFPNLGVDRMGGGGLLSSASSDTVTSSPRLDSPATFPSVQSILSDNSEKFQETDKRCTSIKEAIKFARTNNLLGIICEATPLVRNPYKKDSEISSFLHFYETYMQLLLIILCYNFHLLQ